MATGTINIDWLNGNSQRAYPFREGMLRRPYVGGAAVSELALPNLAVVDMAMATNFDPLPDVYLSSLSLSRFSVSAVLSRVSDGEILAVAASRLEGAGEYSPVNFSGTGVHDDIRGTLVFGDLSRLADTLPYGVYEYPASETLFERRCVLPSIPCVSGIYVKDAYNGGETIRLRGDVALVAGDNIRFEFDEASNAIVVHAEPNSEYSEKCGCSGADSRKEILTINGVSASNVVIEGDGECVNVSTSGGRIRISDTCSKPACGCAELTFLNQKVGEVSSAMNRLEDYFRTLDGRLTELGVSTATLLAEAEAAGS